VIAYMGPASPATIPADVPMLGGAGCWIGPGIVDAHVHLAFGRPDLLATGLVGVRDLGSPLASARTWRSGHRRPAPGTPFIAASGPMLTAPDGYPSQSWGADGFAEFLATPGSARQVVQHCAAAGADVIKIALEPGSADWPVPDPVTVRAVVNAAHDSGLAVVAHALRADMVGRALDAGVDELAHTPTERLSEQLVGRLAEAGVAVVSTLQTFFSDGVGRDAAANAVALHRAGVTLRYGTDLGNAGTHPGVDPRELDRLAECGLGRLGALRAATEGSAQAPGIRRRTGRLRRGESAALVLLPGDPLIEPGVWRAPTAVVADGRIHIN
jgi:imidazolonepropionase-like amidohydrolase